MSRSPVAWDAAFAEIGRELKGYAPRSVILGHASLETAYTWKLFARLLGIEQPAEQLQHCGVPANGCRVNPVRETIYRAG